MTNAVTSSSPHQIASGADCEAFLIVEERGAGADTDVINAVMMTLSRNNSCLEVLGSTVSYWVQTPGHTALTNPGANFVSKNVAFGRFVRKNVSFRVTRWFRRGSSGRYSLQS